MRGKGRCGAGVPPQRQSRTLELCNLRSVLNPPRLPNALLLPAKNMIHPKGVTVFLCLCFEILFPFPCRGFWSTSRSVFPVALVQIPLFK